MYSDLHLENISDLVIYILIKLSKIISTVINPLVVAPITFGLLIYHDQTHNPRHLLFFISILFTTILPFFTIIYHKKLGKLSAYDAPLRQERIELLVIAAIYNAIGFILFRFLRFVIYPVPDLSRPPRLSVCCFVVSNQNLQQKRGTRFSCLAQRHLESNNPIRTTC